MRIEMTRCQGCALDAGVNPDLLQNFWLKLRCLGPDVFTIKKRNNDSTTRDIQNGWMPREKETTNEELRRCVDELNVLQSFVEKHFDEASEAIHDKFDIYEKSADHCYCIYCKCRDGILGVGWRFRDGDLVKARMMATFTLYAYGIQREAEDPALGDFCYRHLPYRADINLSMADNTLFKSAL